MDVVRIEFQDASSRGFRFIMSILIVLRNSFVVFCLSYSNIRHVNLIWAVAFLALAPLQILTIVTVSCSFSVSQYSRLQNSRAKALALLLTSLLPRCLVFSFLHRLHRIARRSCRLRRLGLKEEEGVECPHQLWHSDLAFFGRSHCCACL